MKRATTASEQAELEQAVRQSTQAPTHDGTLHPDRDKTPAEDDIEDEHLEEEHEPTT